MELKKAIFPTSIVLLSQLSGLTIFLWLPRNAAQILNATPGRAEAFASTISGFAFTMMGFLVAVIALLGVVANDIVLPRYDERGNLNSLLILIAGAMLELFVTFILALRIFFVVPSDAYILILIGMVTVDLVLLFLCSVPIVMLIKKSMRKQS